MHRIGVFATRPVDLRLVREHIATLLGNLPEDAAWSFHWFTAWGRFRQALQRSELQLGLLVHTSGGKRSKDIQTLCAEHSVALVCDEAPGELRVAGHLALAALDADALRDMLRSALRKAELDDELRYLAEHDACTGLLRADAFAARLNAHLAPVLANADRRVRGALLCLRLDGFNELENTLGVASAERVLRMAAERLRGVMQRGELLARGEGAEFLAWLRASARPEQSAQRLQQIFEAPFHLSESSAFVRASAGIALAADVLATPTNSVRGNADTDADHGDQLVRRARAAADVVLQRTGARSLVYDPDIERASRRQQVRNALAGAIERDEFDVFYQPIVNISQGNVAGAEALLRWHGQAVGSVSPAHFIPLAEESGAILSIGQWVLRRACQDAVVWLDRFWTQVRIAVNVSAEQFRSGRIHEDLQQLLQELPLHPRQIELEIAERSFLALAREQYPLFETLRDQGFRIVLDEFGSSYASLSYLKQYPVDVLKIDRHLIASLTQPGADVGLVNAMVAMGKSLDMRTVGVGVEVDAQLEILRAAGCDEAQGFYLGAPMSGDEFIATMLRNPAIEGQQFSAVLQG